MIPEQMTAIAIEGGKGPAEALIAAQIDTPKPGPGQILIKVRAAGVNRISLGAQSFDVEMLKLLGRQHVPGDIAETCALLRGPSTPHTIICALGKPCCSRFISGIVPPWPM